MTYFLLLWVFADIFFVLITIGPNLRFFKHWQQHTKQPFRSGVDIPPFPLYDLTIVAMSRPIDLIFKLFFIYFYMHVDLSW